jgi:hypothetical protein
MSSSSHRAGSDTGLNLWIGCWQQILRFWWLRRVYDVAHVAAIEGLHK